jgi:hypothetical protein
MMTLTVVAVTKFKAVIVMKICSVVLFMWALIFRGIYCLHHQGRIKMEYAPNTRSYSVLAKKTMMCITIAEKYHFNQ